MPNLSAVLDFLLGVVCLAIAIGGARRQNDFLYCGFLWVSAAALLGSLNLGGWTQVNPTHVWLSQVSRGPGTLLMGLGVAAAMYGPWHSARWWAAALCVLGAAAVHLLADRPWFDLVSLAQGVVLLIALLALVRYAAKRRENSAAACALGAWLLLIFVAFGLNRIDFPADGPLRRVDVLHVLLTVCYGLVWLAVRSTSAGRG